MLHILPVLNSFTCPGRYFGKHVVPASGTSQFLMKYSVSLSIFLSHSRKAR